MARLRTCQWFETGAEAAADFYVSLFPGASIDGVTRSPSDWPAGSAGEVLTVEFTLLGQAYMALNGGAFFRLDPAVSLSVACETQSEVDRYWDALSADPAAEQCGWLKDRFGLSWQIVPTILPELMAGPDREAAARVMTAMMSMKKLDVAALERAAAG